MPKFKWDIFGDFQTLCFWRVFCKSYFFVVSSIVTIFLFGSVTMALFYRNDLVLLYSIYKSILPNVTNTKILLYWRVLVRYHRLIKWNLVVIRWTLFWYNSMRVWQFFTSELFFLNISKVIFFSVVIKNADFINKWSKTVYFINEWSKTVDFINEWSKTSDFIN